MVWGYLSEFWSQVSSTTINAWEYTQEWFYNIGNAVAGAIGNLFDFIIHYFNDLLMFFAWIGYNFGIILSQVIAPLRYVFIFTKSFASTCFSTPVLPEDLTGFSTTTSSFLQSLPYWNVINLCIVVLVLFIGGIAIIKLFLKL
jgi:hypothetical protein